MYTPRGENWHVPILAASSITTEQRKELERRIYQRLTAVLAVADGKTQEEVADLLGIGLTQLGEWLRVFRDQGSTSCANASSPDHSWPRPPIPTAEPQRLFSASRPRDGGNGRRGRGRDGSVRAYRHGRLAVQQHATEKDSQPQQTGQGRNPRPRPHRAGRRPLPEDAARHRQEEHDERGDAHQNREQRVVHGVILLPAITVLP
jgi:hypothetical protein